MVLGVLMCLGSSRALVQEPVPEDLSGRTVDPFAGQEQVEVFLFARSDCPITQRYAPELRRIARVFERQPVKFWLVFPDPAETRTNVRSFIDQFGFPGTPIFDPKHTLVRRAKATTAPEAAVFNRNGMLVYHGRIDDWYVDIGKASSAPRVHDLEDAIAATLSLRPVAHAATKAVGCSLADIE